MFIDDNGGKNSITSSFSFFSLFSPSFFYRFCSCVSSLFIFFFLHSFSSSVSFLIPSVDCPSNLQFPFYSSLFPGFPFLRPILFSPVLPIFTLALTFLPLPLSPLLCPQFPSSLHIFPSPCHSPSPPTHLPFVTRGRSADHLPGCDGIPRARMYLPGCLVFVVSVPVGIGKIDKKRTSPS